MRIFLTFLFFIFTITLSAQTISGTVLKKNPVAQIPIEGAQINILGTNIGTETNDLGQFKITVDSLPVTLRISYLGYKTQAVTIDTVDTVNFIIDLEQNNALLPEAIISSKRKIDTLTFAPYSVVDYTFAGDNILLLAYKNFKEKYYLLYISPEGNPICSLQLKDINPIQLHKACDEQVLLETTLDAKTIWANDKQITFLNSISLKDFESTFEACHVQTSTHSYLQQYYYHGQAVRYWKFNKKPPLEKTALKIIFYEQGLDWFIEEAGLFNQNRGEYMDSLNSDEMKELMNTPVQNNAYMKTFYPTIYCPLFGYNDTLYLFDHINHQLLTLNEKGEILNSITIDYPSMKRWKDLIYFDKYNGKAYTGFDTKWGNIIRPIDLKTGKLGSPIQLDYPFPSNITARKGYLYFLYNSDTHHNKDKLLHRMEVK